MPEKYKHSKIEYKGQILTINTISQKEGISKGTLKKYYDFTQNIEEAVKLAKESSTKQNRISYNGQELSMHAIAKLEGIGFHTLDRIYKETQDIYEAVKLSKEAQSQRRESITHIPYNGKMLALKAIAKLERVSPNTLRRKYQQTNDIYEAVKQAKEIYVSQKDRTSQISYNGQILSLSAIAKLEGFSSTALAKYYVKAHQDIYEAVKLTKEGQIAQEKRISKIPYKGQTLSIHAIAKLEGLTWQTLINKYKQIQDIEKAVMLCKQIKSRRDKKKEVVDTKQLGKLNYYDISLILGIKYNELINLLDAGNPIDAIIEQNLNSNSKTRNSGKVERINLENGQSLAEYCIANKLNYSCIYRAMKIYDKTLEEAVANYNQNGQETPKAWIYEKYGILFKHLMLSESIDSGTVIRYMREDYLPLEQAIEKYIIRKNAQKDDLDKDWMEELYDLLSDEDLSKEEYETGKKNFYVDEKEESCIKKSKARFNEVKRKLLLFDIAESLETELFEPEEEKELLELYDVTEDEIDIIFKELHKGFTSPGVLLGKEQKSPITPEQIKQRDYNIRKYKEMVRENKQDKDIMLVMRFMVGTNVETNIECRNEIQRELDKEKQDLDY